jgi:hypothetical protein
MLKYFSVIGYKNFDQLIELDFSDVRDYRFSTDCINSGLLGKMIIYGKNAIGKTNLSRALFDITFIRRLSKDYKDEYYLSLGNTCGYAEFRYVFKFGNETVEYRYRKTGLFELIYEKILINGELLVEHDRKCPHDIVAPGLKKIAPTLVLNFDEVESVFAYIVTNTPLDADHPLKKVERFIRCLFLDISGENAGAFSFVNMRYIIADEGAVSEFEEFLHIAGIKNNLIVLENPAGKRALYFDTTPPLPFDSVASSGTKTLSSLFVMYSMAKSIVSAHGSCLLILDEFDAFYHYELAEHIVKMFLKLPSVQVIFTSHNTTLLTNRYMRPDCCFIMTDNKLTALPNATNMELREGHNLEKLFIGGEFDE